MQSFCWPKFLEIMYRTLIVFILRYSSNAQCVFITWWSRSGRKLPWHNLKTTEPQIYSSVQNHRLYKCIHSIMSVVWFRVLSFCESIWQRLYVHRWIKFICFIYLWKWKFKWVMSESDNSWRKWNKRRKLIITNWRWISKLTWVIARWIPNYRKWNQEKNIQLLSPTKFGIPNLFIVL